VSDAHVLHTHLPGLLSKMAVNSAAGTGTAVTPKWPGYTSNGSYYLDLQDTNLGADVNTVATCPSGSSCQNKTAEVITDRSSPPARDRVSPGG
jgi:hypothetical protein